MTKPTEPDTAGTPRLTRRRALGLAAAAGATGLLPSLPPASAQAGGLGALAASVGIALGTAVAPMVLKEPAYGDIVAADARLVTPEWGMNFHFMREKPDAPQYWYGDEMIGFAKARGLKVHGQSLIWDYEQPAWLKAASRGERIGVFDRHIDETLARWPLPTWSVVNEPFWPDEGLVGGFRPGAWYDTFGTAYVERAFKRAAAASPGSRLMLNEAQCERYDDLGEKFRPRMLGLVDRLKDAGVKLDIVGLQGHLQLHVAHDDARFVGFLHELAKRGVEIWMTELDVNDVYAAKDTEERDRAVARRYSDFLSAVLTVPQVKSLTFWQLADKHSWYRIEWYLKSAPPAHRHWPARPLLYDDQLQRKPAWHAVRQALAERKAR